MNVEAAMRTIAALQSLGRLENVDDALVTGFMSLAAALDEKPTDAGLWREYRAYEQRLRATGGGDDDLARLLADLQTPVGDPPTA